MPGHTCIFEFENNLRPLKIDLISLSIGDFLTRQIEANLKLDINTIIGFTIKFYGQFVG